MKFTSGPWKYALNVGPTAALIVADDGSTILRLTTNVRDSRFEANVRLVSTAPEMYEALRELVRCVRGGDETSGVSMDDALMDADAALEKAKP